MGEAYRSLDTFSPSALARAWIDSSLLVIALAMARTLMPLLARLRTYVGDGGKRIGMKRANDLRPRQDGPSGWKAG